MVSNLPEVIDVSNFLGYFKKYGKVISCYINGVERNGSLEFESSLVINRVIHDVHVLN